MGNPIFNPMGNNPLQMLAQLMASGNNPQNIMRGLMQNNPNFNNLINQIKESGMSPRDFAMNYARQNNIDMNAIMQMANQMGIKL